MNRRLLFPLFLLFTSGLAYSQGGNTLTIRFSGAPSGPCSPFMLGVNNATGGEYNCTSGGAWNLIGGGGAGGTVTSVSFTGGLISVANPTTTPAFTVAGTSGGIPYFSGATTWATSGALTANGVVLGGGAGASPTVTSADSTTTHALFATAGAPAFRALAAGDIPSGAVTWDLLGNPAGNLSLTMAGNTSTFNTTTALAQMFAWKNTTAAVVGTSQGSPVPALCGRAFHGSADVEDCLTLKELPGNGNDAAIAFTIGHTGTSTGLVTLGLPNINLPIGTAAAPSINFVGFTNYGFFFDNTYGAGYSSNGATALGFDGTGIRTLAANTFRWCATTIASCTQDTGLGRPAAGVVSADTSAIGNGLGSYKAAKFLTAANCSNAASPAVCAAASAGVVAVPTGTNPTLTINTTAITATSQVFLQIDESATIAATTCNTTLSTLVQPVVTARTAATSFTIQIGAVIASNPVCVSYFIVN